MNILYPEHTPPAPPEGMKWGYRGLGWKPRRVVTYYLAGEPDIIEATPAGEPTYHYFEAVPITETTYHGANVHRSRNEQAAKMNDMFNENPTDPKGEAGSRKAPLYLLPSFPLHEASWVLKYGSEVYGKFNWRENEVCASTYRSAMQRHLDQWFDGGEDVDEETRRSHLAHVIANCCILMDAAKHQTLVDDRP